MEKGVVRGRGQNEGGRGGAGVVFNSLKFGLTWGEKENGASQRSDPDVSFTIHQDSRGKATRITVFRANLLTGGATHME